MNMKILIINIYVSLKNLQENFEESNIPLTLILIILNGHRMNLLNMDRNSFETVMLLFKVQFFLKR